jgi:hypothetical protein
MSSRTSEPTGRREAPPDDRLRERDPGPITTNVHFARSWGRSFVYNRHRWLWVPAFAGTTVRAYQSSGTQSDLLDGQISRVRQLACPAPFAKIFLFSPDPNQFTDSSVPSLRGALAIVTDAGRDAVDAGGAKDEGADLRTAKSCGSDASTPASSLARRRARRR